MSIAFNKYNQFVLDLCSGVHQFQTGTAHVFKLALTNTAPTASSNAVLADITELSTSGGYTAGGVSCGTVTGSQTSGTFKLLLGTNPSWTGSGGGFTFRYAVLYNSTPSSPLKPLIGYYDYGSALTINAGDTFTVTFDGSAGVFTLA